MKKTYLTAILFFLILPAFAQTDYKQKTITVSGTAEMEITPDEIYVDIELQEYQKKGETKKDLETLKTGFLEACKAAGLSDSVITIKMYSGDNNYYYLRKKIKNNDLKASITYRVMFYDSKQMDELIRRLDDEATRKFQITETSYSNIPEIKKQLKIKAIQAAKTKAVYLTEAIGEKVGDAVSIIENSEHYYNFENAQVSNYLNSSVFLDERKPPADIDFTKLKYKFSIAVVFALK